MRRREFIALLGGAAAARPLGVQAERPQERILYFTHSAGYRHDVIPLSRTILAQLGSRSGRFEVTATEDTSEFATENLERYAAVMFFTTGELPMSAAQRAALLNFVRAGRGFLGIHSATDTFYTWPDYLDLVGDAAFHPGGKFFVTAGWDTTLRVWGYPSLKPLAVLKQSHPLRGVSWSPDGKRLASASDDGVARIWEAAE